MEVLRQKQAKRLLADRRLSGKISVTARIAWNDDLELAARKALRLLAHCRYGPPREAAGVLSKALEDCDRRRPRRSELIG